MALTEAENESSEEPAATHAPEQQSPSKVTQLGAPLWLPGHDVLVVAQSVARPPDLVEGYGLADRVRALLLGDRWKAATNVATAVAVLLFLITVPTLHTGVSGWLKLAIFQAWTLGLMLVMTRQVRSVGVVTLTRYWLSGMFLVAIVMFFLSGPLSSLADRADVFVYPLIEELLKAAPLAVAAMMGRRVWRHPGLSDFAVLGFAVGAGYGFHAAGLHRRDASSGFDPDFGFLVPSTVRVEGLFVAGHAVSASLIALAIGLFVLHRHQPVAVAAASTIVALTVLDRMASVDGAGTLNWVRSLTFGGKLLALIFAAGLVAAVALDRRRLAKTGERDHLFPPESSRVSTRPTNDADLLRGVRRGNYRRLRNGMHNTADAVSLQWPPHSEATSPPLAELARLARAAGVAAGPGTSSSGWASDPDEAGRLRFAGPDGFTPYGAGNDLVSSGPPPQVAALNDPALDEATRSAMQREVELAERRVQRSGHAGPTTTTLSEDRAGPNPQRLTIRGRGEDYWQYVGVSLIAVVLFVVVRLLTAGDLGDNLATLPLHLPDGTKSPSKIIGLLGGLATAIAIRGRNQVQLGSGWDVGPGDDPRPVRPRECEA